MLYLSGGATQEGATSDQKENGQPKSPKQQQKGVKGPKGPKGGKAANTSSEEQVRELRLKKVCNCLSNDWEGVIQARMTWITGHWVHLLALFLTAINRLLTANSVAAFVAGWAVCWQGHVHRLGHVTACIAIRRSLALASHCYSGQNSTACILSSCLFEQSIQCEVCRLLI